MTQPNNRSTLGSEFLGEKPAEEGLGMGEMANRIVAHLTERSNSGKGQPYPSHGLVGVFGHWGAGKTHLLNLIGEKLVEQSTPDAPCLVCTFRTWEYEAEADLASAFIRCLISEQNYPWGQMYPAFDQTLPSKITFRQAVWEFADFVHNLGKSVHDRGKLSDVRTLAALSRGTQALLDFRESGQVLPPEPVADQIRRAMQGLMAKLAPESGRLYVLVDDLDRCSPPNIVRLFEWFKNHLDTDRCTYVLGLDHRIAAKAIVGHYKDYMSFEKQESLDYGYRYLDKLFEVEFEILPNPATERMVLARLRMDARSLAEWTRREIGRDFGGEPEMKALLGMTALWVPRVLLRAVSTFRMSLEALIKQDKADKTLFSNDLPSSFPFWLFLLSALHHLFPPDHVESFVRADLKKCQKDKGIGSVLDGERNDRKYGATDPRSDFIAEMNGIRTEALTEQQIRYLYRTVREKTPRGFRNVAEAG
uniref:KAP family P-loop domain-containing protein n=1 Tax=Candidatus Kentrum sp. FM TaxID=2126340 RepID=A0A450RZ61_9GAMM|nr:MAG: KAP family P-loop domain-containing protein [Candidatus Kentron sp. FM]VFJ53664.1 MAG: KAP family P-loop domain-containing protein [Candidatus Kentron sp. FM]VFK09881.1 MAG: KAP family P-loop domain-containing protein [Candidatus Kentron sp. FM]